MLYAAELTDLDTRRSKHCPSESLRTFAARATIIVETLNTVFLPKWADGYRNAETVSRVQDPNSRSRTIIFSWAQLRGCDTITLSEIADIHRNTDDILAQNFQESWLPSSLLFVHRGCKARTHSKAEDPDNRGIRAATVRSCCAAAVLYRFPRSTNEMRSE